MGNGALAIGPKLPRPSSTLPLRALAHLSCPRWNRLLSDSVRRRQLRSSLLPILQSWEQELRRQHPNVITNIYDQRVGELTSWQGHDIGIECTFKNVAPEWPDNVALSVSLKHLHDTPSIHSADVMWGHPSG
jgi:hypothetical protein